MKSIKQQYIDLREGNMTQANFMRNLRMTMPQYVTNITSFEDSVRILKNKGILTEADMNEKLMFPLMDQWLEDVKDIIEDKWQNGKINQAEYGSLMTKLSTQSEDIIAKYGETDAEEAATELLDSVSHLGNEYDPGPGEDEDFERDYDMDYEEPNEPFDMAESLNEAKDEKTKWTNTSGKGMYDQFAEINNLNGQEVLIGIDYEIEKNPELTKTAAAKIVIKNLKKNPIYYTSSLMAGKEGYEPEYLGGKSANAEARQMQPLDKNMGNVVDKKMGMQPVKGIEKPKKDADAKKETNKAEKNIKLMSLIAKTVRGLKKMDATGEKMKKVAIKEGVEKDIKGQIIKATNADGATFTKNGRAIAIDNGEEVKILGFKEDQGKIKAIIDKGMFASSIDIDGLELSPKDNISKANLGSVKESAEDRLAEQIRQYIKETMDGMELMDRTGLDEIDFNQIAMGNSQPHTPSQPKASFEGKWIDIKDKNEFINKFHISNTSPLVDIVARAIGSNSNYAITNKDGKFYVYTFTQTANPGKPSQAFNSLEDAKKSVKL